MRTPPVRTRRWTRAEYERLVEKGFFRSDERLELLDGELIVRSRRVAFMPPPVLVVEVAETSLALDRRRKARLYARAGIHEYWILNLQDRVLEVYRQPEPSRPGGKYRSGRLFKSGAVSPLRAPRARIRVGDLLL